MTSPDSRKSTIYDHPLYYDILFGWDRSREAGFYHRVFETRGVAADEQILEVACGTGQVARRLAALGWSVTGLDESPDMLAFLRVQAATEGVRAEAICANMTAFSNETKFGGALNPMSSFRLLCSDADAIAHLRTMAAALRQGGVYVLDMTFAEAGDESPVTTEESWVMERGDVTVRAEDDAIFVSDDGEPSVLAWGREGHLRVYTSDAFGHLVSESADFEIESWHPESARDEDVTYFDVEHTAEPPLSGRAMVVLRRS